MSIRALEAASKAAEQAGTPVSRSRAELNTARAMGQSEPYGRAAGLARDPQSHCVEVAKAEALVDIAESLRAIRELLAERPYGGPNL